MPHRIAIVEGDITRLEVDAIVNAANSSLLGGGGVNGAIHRAAGRALYDACKTLGGCDTGEAKITPGFNLPARYVIHTVGPVWSGRGEDRLLANCYLNSFALALTHDLASIAYPAISTGAYRFPPTAPHRSRCELCLLHSRLRLQCSASYSAASALNRASTTSGPLMLPWT